MPQNFGFIPTVVSQQNAVEGSDGNVYCTVGGTLTQITPAGVETDFPSPGGNGGYEPWAIVVASDGSLWFGGYGVSYKYIFQCDTSGNVLNAFQTDTSSSEPLLIAGPGPYVYDTNLSGAFHQIPQIMQMDMNGNLNILVPPNTAWNTSPGITLLGTDGTYLYLASLQSGVTTIYAMDEYGNFTVLNASATFPNVTYGPWVFDGTHFWQADGFRLYKMDTSGNFTGPISVSPTPAHSMGAYFCFDGTSLWFPYAAQTRVIDYTPFPHYVTTYDGGVYEINLTTLVATQYDFGSLSQAQCALNGPGGVWVTDNGWYNSLTGDQYRGLWIPGGSQIVMMP